MKWRRSGRCSMGKKQPKPLPKREYHAATFHGTVGIPYDHNLQNFLNNMATDGWEFVQLSGNIAIFRREL